jgi:AcrR family transcriptional regulator
MVSLRDMATKKRAYHHGDLRRTLLEASVALILERGVDELSLREVARRAGVSPAAPYHHFSSRNVLLAALALEGFAALEKGMRGAHARVATEHPIRRLCAIGEAYVTFAVTHPAHFRLMFRSSFEPTQEMPHSDAPAAAFDILLDAVADVLGDAQVRAHTDQRGLVLLAWSLVHGAAELLLDGPLAGGLPALAVRARDVPTLVPRAFAALLGALGSPPAAAGPPSEFGRSRKIKT